MPSDLRIFLVRHGESEANLDKSLHQRVADSKIPLSTRGWKHADAAGKAIANWYSQGDRLRGAIRIWQSPYQRARETASQVARVVTALPTSGHPIDQRESIHLREQEYGLFDGVPDDELPVQFPKEHALYDKLERFEGKVFARMPMGESRIDVCQRVHQFFGTLHRDAERHGIRDVVLVTHGVTMRAFAMMWLGLPYEWLEKEPNPRNCSVLLIENRQMTWVFEGFESARGTAQEAREAGLISPISSVDCDSDEGVSFDPNDRFGVPAEIITEEYADHAALGIIRDGCYVPTRAEVASLPSKQLIRLLQGWFWESPSSLIPSGSQERVVIDILEKRPDAGDFKTFINDWKRSNQPRQDA